MIDDAVRCEHVRGYTCTYAIEPFTLAQYTFAMVPCKPFEDVTLFGVRGGWGLGGNVWGLLGVGLGPGFFGMVHSMSHTHENGVDDGWHTHGMDGMAHSMSHTHTHTKMEWMMDGTRMQAKPSMRHHQ